MLIKLNARKTALLLALVAAMEMASASVVVNNAFFNYEHRALNSLGFASGEFIRFGANSVVSSISGSATGVTGFATTTNTVTGNPVSRTINYSPGPIIPNFFSRYLAVDPGLLGPWTLNFTDGTSTAQRVVSLPAGSGLIPFVSSITLGGSSEFPTFNWTPPAGTTVNGYRVNIYDKSLINTNPAAGPTNNGQVANRDFAPGTTSYTVNAADFSVPGYAFAIGKNYSVEISALQTKDGTSNTNNANLSSVARTYADFTPHETGGLEVHLPVVNQGGSFVFNVEVVAGQTYYIDPVVAVGYDYEIGVGDPNFQTVVLPSGIGDGLFDIFGFDSVGDLVLLAQDWLAGAVFNFGVGGVSRFRVTDIETSAGLDPANATAFVTGLTFTGSGRFTGTQTPLTLEIPEPSGIALLGAGIIGLLVVRRRKAGLATAMPEQAAA